MHSGTILRAPAGSRAPLVAAPGNRHGQPDIFSEYLVPYYKLDEIFDAIVTSWQERTADKGELGLLALQRIAGQIRPRETLLIENKRKNVDAWRSKGGQAYLFSGEEQFDLDLRSTLAEFAATAGMAAAVTPRSP